MKIPYLGQQNPYLSAVRMTREWQKSIKQLAHLTAVELFWNEKISSTWNKLYNQLGQRQCWKTFISLDRADRAEGTKVELTGRSKTSTKYKGLRLKSSLQCSVTDGRDTTWQWPPRHTQQPATTHERTCCSWFNLHKTIIALDWWHLTTVLIYLTISPFLCEIFHILGVSRENFIFFI